MLVGVSTWNPYEQRSYLLRIDPCEHSYEHFSIIYQWRRPSHIRRLYYICLSNFFQVDFLRPEKLLACVWMSFFVSCSIPPHLLHFCYHQHLSYPGPICPGVIYLSQSTPLSLFSPCSNITTLNGDHLSESICFSPSGQHHCLLPPHLHGFAIRKLHAPFHQQRNVCPYQVTGCHASTLPPKNSHPQIKQWSYGPLPTNSWKPPSQCMPQKMWVMDNQLVSTVLSHIRVLCTKRTHGWQDPGGISKTEGSGGLFELFNYSVPICFGTGSMTANGSTALTRRPGMQQCWCQDSGGCAGQKDWL